MANDERAAQPTPEGSGRESEEQRGSRTSRRQFVKGAVAATGAAAAASYVKPSLRALGVPAALAISPAPTPTPTPTPRIRGCTPGFWGNSPVGTALWNAVNDPDWSAAGLLGTNPYIHTTLFNSFFTPHPNLAGLTMLDLVSTGGGPDPVRKAARSLVAAYLNASAYGSAYAYTTAQLSSMWANTVANPGKDNKAFLDLHEQLDAANNFCH